MEIDDDQQIADELDLFRSNQSSHLLELYLRAFNAESGNHIAPCSGER